MVPGARDRQEALHDAETAAEDATSGSPGPVKTWLQLTEPKAARFSKVRLRARQSRKFG